MRQWLVALAVLVATSGCGGVVSSVFIIQGTITLAGARAANAEKLATYEYVSAEAYLKKAREAHSYADFEHSLRFARLSVERAQEAKRKAAAQNKPPAEMVTGSTQAGASVPDNTTPSTPPPTYPQQPAPYVQPR